jgi:hypothetical protein
MSSTQPIGDAGCRVTGLAVELEEREGDQEAGEDRDCIAVYFPFRRRTSPKIAPRSGVARVEQPAAGDERFSQGAADMGESRGDGGATFLWPREDVRTGISTPLSLVSLRPGVVLAGVDADISTISFHGSVSVPGDEDDGIFSGGGGSTRRWRIDSEDWEFGHTTPVGLAMDAERRQVAWALGDGVELADPERSVVLRRFNEPQVAFFDASFSPDGHVIAAGGADSADSYSIFFFDVRESARGAVAHVPHPVDARTPPGKAGAVQHSHSRALMSVQFLDEQHVVSCAVSDSGDAVQITDRAGKVRARWQGDSAATVCCVCDESTVLLGHTSGAVSLWSHNGEGYGSVGTHQGPVTSLCAIPDSAQFVSGGSDEQVYIGALPGTRTRVKAAHKT